MTCGEPTTCAIEETVARLDGIVNGIGTGVIVDFPETGEKFSRPVVRMEGCLETHPKPTRGIG